MKSCARSAVLVAALAGCGEARSGGRDAGREEDASVADDGSLASDASAEVDAAPTLDACGEVTPEFVLGGGGCPMAHCDPGLTDRAPLAPPTSPVAARFTVDGNATVGLGCTSNGERFACQLSGRDGALVVFDTAGNELWSSDVTGGAAAAPMIAENGDVIATGDGVAARFSPTGCVRWQQTGFASQPISPTLVGDRVALFTRATTTDGVVHAPIVALDVRTGAIVGAPLELRCGEDGVDCDVEGGVIAGTNTVGAHVGADGARLYGTSSIAVPTGSAGADAASAGRLLAIELTDAGPVLRWSFPFRGASGGSPLVVDEAGEAHVYFDGDGVAGASSDAWRLFGLADEGDSYRELFAPVALPGDVEASAALDPAGGLWTFSVGDSYLHCYSRTDGSACGSINVDALVGGGVGAAYVPSSAMTVMGGDSDPVMIVGAARDGASVLRSSKILAVRLRAGTLAWSFDLDSPTLSQFASASDGGRTLVVVPTSLSGVVGLVSP